MTIIVRVLIIWGWCRCVCHSIIQTAQLGWFLVTQQCRNRRAIGRALHWFKVWLFGPKSS